MRAVQLLEKYDNTVAQGWIPIFVDDGRDALKLTEACVEAAVSTIEVTCRRPEALEEIRRIKDRWPELTVLAGSTVDDDRVAQYVHERGSPLPTIDQLADAGADGFVSIFPFAQTTIRKYASTHLLIPGVSTLGEAYSMIVEGAHFAKMVLTPAETIGLYTSRPTHGVIPFLVTGSVTEDQFECYVRNGAVLLAGGWDIMLPADSERDNVQEYTDAVLRYTRGIALARERSGWVVPHGGPYPWFSPFDRQ